MATRRIINSERTILEKNDHPDENSNISPAVPSSVIYKLLGFTLAMFVIPIGSYFVTVNTLFRGNSSFAGGFAALMANIVLVSYIIVAMKEDQSEYQEHKEKKSKKDQ